MLPRQRSEESLSAELYVRCLSPTSSRFASPLSSASEASRFPPANAGSAALQRQCQQKEKEQSGRHDHQQAILWSWRRPSPADTPLGASRAEVNAPSPPPPIKHILRFAAIPSTTAVPSSSYDCAFSPPYLDCPSPDATGSDALPQSTGATAPRISLGAETALPPASRSLQTALAALAEPSPATPVGDLSRTHPLFTVNLTSDAEPGATPSHPPAPSPAPLLAILSAATPVCTAASSPLPGIVDASSPDELSHQPDSCSATTWKRLLVTERQTAASPKKEAGYFVFGELNQSSEKGTLRQRRGSRADDSPSHTAVQTAEARRQQQHGPSVSGSPASAPAVAASSTAAAGASASLFPVPASPCSADGPASIGRSSPAWSRDLRSASPAAPAFPPCSLSLSTLLALAPPPVHPPFITPASDARRRAQAAAPQAPAAAEPRAAAEDSEQQQQPPPAQEQQRQQQRQNSRDEDDNESPPNSPPSASYSRQTEGPSSGAVPFSSSSARPEAAAPAAARKSKCASASSSRIEALGETRCSSNSLTALFPQAYAAPATTAAAGSQELAAAKCSNEPSAQGFSLKRSSCTWAPRLTPAADEGLRAADFHPSQQQQHSQHEKQPQRHSDLQQQSQQQQDLPLSDTSQKRVAAKRAEAACLWAGAAAAANMAASAAREVRCGRRGAGEEVEDALTPARDPEEHGPDPCACGEDEGNRASVRTPLLGEDREERGEFCRGCCAAGSGQSSSSSNRTTTGCNSSSRQGSRRGGAMRGIVLVLAGVGIGLGLWPMLVSFLTFRLLHTWTDLAAGARGSEGPPQQGGDFDVDLHSSEDDSSSTGGRGGAPGRQQQQQVPPLPTPPPSFSPIRFADLAGLQEVKTELQELVEFLREPQKFEKLGARLPKGVLLVGPPGTGKTALARAVATEAGVPYLYASGSEFVEVYVGQGARRVRGLFAYARMHSPCIIFLDELDAVGGRRTAAAAGPGSREHDQTLNQLLVEMDGFNSQHNRLVVLAATNRVDTLDPALLRPGRFDRLVYVPLPDVAAREAILLKYLQRVPLVPEGKEEEDREKEGEQQWPQLEEQKADSKQQQKGERQRDTSSAATAMFQQKKWEEQHEKVKQQQQEKLHQEQRRPLSSGEKTEQAGQTNKEDTLQQPPSNSSNTAKDGSSRKTDFSEGTPGQQGRHRYTDRESGGGPTLGEQEKQKQQQQQQKQGEQQQQRAERKETGETAKQDQMRLQGQEEEKDRRLTPDSPQQGKEGEQQEQQPREQKAQQKLAKDEADTPLRKEQEAATGREKSGPVEGGVDAAGAAATADACATHSRQSKKKGIRQRRQEITPLHRELAKQMARLTPGFSGAELENLVNEAALLAARNNKEVVSLQELQEARDKATMGPARKSRVMSAWQRQLTAYHEAGHAVVAFYLQPYADPIHKATVVSRGSALGFVEQVPLEDRYGHGVAQLEARLCVCMGGRVAERLVFGREALSNGASSDIETATKMAYAMVTEWGMSEKLGPLSYKTHGRSRRAFISSQTAALVEQEVKELVMTAERKAEQLLRKHRSKLRAVALQLLEKETLSGEEIAELIDPTGSYRRKVEQLRQHMQQGETPGLLQRVVVLLQRGIRTLRATFFPTSPHDSKDAAAEEKKKHDEEAKIEEQQANEDEKQAVLQPGTVEEEEEEEQQQQHSDGGTETKPTRQQPHEKEERHDATEEMTKRGKFPAQERTQQQQTELQTDGGSSKEAKSAAEEEGDRKQRGDATAPVGRQQQRRHRDRNNADDDNESDAGGGSSSCSRPSCSSKTSSRLTPSSDSNSKNSSDSSRMESELCSCEGEGLDNSERVQRGSNDEDGSLAASDDTTAQREAALLQLLGGETQQQETSAAAVWNPRVVHISKHGVRLPQQERQQKVFDRQRLTALLLLRGAEDGTACSDVRAVAGNAVAFCPAVGLVADIDAGADARGLCRGACEAADVRDAETAAAATDAPGPAAAAVAASESAASAAQVGATTPGEAAAAAEEEAAGGGRRRRTGALRRGMSEGAAAEIQGRESLWKEQQDGEHSLLQLQAIERTLRPAYQQEQLLGVREKPPAAGEADDARAAERSVFDPEGGGGGELAAAGKGEAAAAGTTATEESNSGRDVHWLLPASPLLQQQQRRKKQQQQWQLTPWGPGIVTVGEGYSL